MNNGEMASWFIISTKPKQEFIAEKNLQSLGADVYLPLYKKIQKKNKQKIEVVSPLFSGYLFAHFSITEMYHKVRYTRGVKSVLGNNQYLWTLEAEKVNDIRSREKDGVVVLKKKEDHFKNGDRILIDEGDFEEYDHEQDFVGGSDSIEFEKELE